MVAAGPGPAAPPGGTYNGAAGRTSLETRPATAVGN